MPARASGFDLGLPGPLGLFTVCISNRQALGHKGTPGSIPGDGLVEVTAGNHCRSRLFPPQPFPGYPHPIPWII